MNEIMWIVGFTISWCEWQAEKVRMASWDLQFQSLEMLTVKSNASSVSPIEHY